MTDTGPVLRILHTMNVEDNKIIRMLWAQGNPRHAVCDGVNFSAGSEHWLAFESYVTKFWPELGDNFYSCFESGGPLANGLMHGYYDKESHTFFWDFMYGA